VVEEQDDKECDVPFAAPVCTGKGCQWTEQDGEVDGKLGGMSCAAMKDWGESGMHDSEREYVRCIRQERDVECWGMKGGGKEHDVERVYGIR
jgi:hypothetical protein